VTRRRFARWRRISSGGALLLLAASCTPAVQSPPASAAPIPGAYRKVVSFSILEDYDKGESLAEVERDFALFHELGIPTWRGSFGWDDYEPEPGRFDFAWLHEFAGAAARAGITLRPYVAYTPEWAAVGGRDADAWNDPPRDLDAWTRFVRTLADSLSRHANIRSYEIYNEENVRQWWDGTAAEYAAVLGAAATAVRSADPDAAVLLGGMVWPDADWADAVCSVGDNGGGIDVIPFHAYPETWTPDSVQVENYLGATIAADFDAACGRKPIWINEAGFATTPGRSEREQAAWWARAIATFAAHPRIEHIGVYEIKDLPPGAPVIGDAPNHHLGLTDAGRRKKLAFHTVALLVRLLADDTLAVADSALVVEGKDGAGAATYAHLFLRDDGRQILLAWAKGRVRTVRIRLPRAARRALAWALDGRSTPYRRFDGRVLDDVRLAPGDVRIFEIVP
jgi:hypothetical protein